MVSIITAWGVRWTGLPHSLNTNGDHLIKDNLGRYCLQTFETAKFLSLCRFKGLWTVTVQIIFDYIISVGLWSVGESHPLDSQCCDYAHHPFMIMSASSRVNLFTCCDYMCIKICTTDYLLHYEHNTCKQITGIGTVVGRGRSLFETHLSKT